MTLDLRSAVGDAVRSRVIGPRGASLAQELGRADGARWFATDRPIHRVHADPAMFIGGIRAILLQSLHPLAMAGVAQHSDYRADPWGRLQRTASFLAATTFGTEDHAERAVAMVRRVHERVVGSAPDGRPYAANDPHLLAWVHLAEVDSFLAAHRAYGRDPLGAEQQDAYIADMAVIASRLGVVAPPTDTTELRRQLKAFEPELATTAEARDAARFLLTPPLPLAARAPYALLYGAAVASLPWWARLALWLPPFTPITDRALVRPAAGVVTDVLRWALDHPDTAPPTTPTA